MAVEQVMARAEANINDQQSGTWMHYASGSLSMKKIWGQRSQASLDGAQMQQNNYWIPVTN